MRGKYIKFIAAVLACMLMLCSCESMKSFTVKGTDGESITISVKTDGGYDLKHKGSDFDVLKDDKVILRGSIVNPDAWENFQQMMNSIKQWKVYQEQYGHRQKQEANNRQNGFMNEQEASMRIQDQEKKIV